MSVAVDATETLIAQAYVVIIGFLISQFAACSYRLSENRANLLRACASCDDECTHTSL